MGVVVGIREEKKAKQRPSLRSTPAQSLEGGGRRRRRLEKDLGERGKERGTDWTDWRWNASREKVRWGKDEKRKTIAV